MPKVSLERLALFETLGDSNLEGTSMWKPMNPVGNRVITEHVMDFLGKSHLINRGGMDVAHFGRNLAEITIRVVHVGLWFLDDLNHPRFHRILVFNLLETGFANLAHWFCLVVLTVRVGLDSGGVSLVVLRRVLNGRAHGGGERRLEGSWILCFLRGIHHCGGRTAELTTTSCLLSEEERNCNKKSPLFLLTCFVLIQCANIEWRPGRAFVQT